MAGRPRQGPELEYKMSTNARYRYAISFICRNEQILRADSMAMKLLNHIISDFWKEVRTLNSCRVSLPCTLDGVSGAENIAELWRQHYSSLFNPLVAPARKRRFNFILFAFLISLCC